MAVTLEEALAELTHAHHTMRVLEYLAECLQPFLGEDAGVVKELIAEGAPITVVPREVLHEVLGDLLSDIDKLSEEVDQMRGHHVVPPPKKELPVTVPGVVAKKKGRPAKEKKA